MKIGLITHLPLWPFSGGSSFRVYRYVKEMCKKHEVYAVAPRDKKVSIAEVKKQFGPNLHFYPFEKFEVSRFVKQKQIRYGLFALLSINKIIEIHKKHGLDVVVCHNSICVPPALVLKKLFGVPYILDIVDIVTGYSQKMSENNVKNYINKVLFKLIFLNMEKSFARWANKTISITEELSKALEVKEFSVVHDGINLKTFTVRKNKKQIKKRLKLEKKKIVIFTSILDPCQNPEIIVNAAPEIIKKIPNVVFIFTGKGTSIPSLKELIKRKKLEKHFIFTGWLEMDDFLDYLSIADIGLVTHPDNLSGRVMFPIKLSEYWAMKMPAVISNLPQLQKVVKKSGGGLLFDPASPKDLAEKIILAFNSNMKKMGQGGKKLIEREYDWDKVSMRFVEEVEKLIKFKRKI